MGKKKKKNLELKMIINKNRVITLRANFLDKAGIEAVAEESNLSISEYLLQLHEEFKNRSMALAETEQFARVQALVNEGFTCHGYKKAPDGKRYYFSGPITRGGIFLEPTGELKWFVLNESRQLDQYNKEFLQSLTPVKLPGSKGGK